MCKLHYAENKTDLYIWIFELYEIKSFRFRANFWIPFHRVRTCGTSRKENAKTTLSGAGCTRGPDLPLKHQKGHVNHLILNSHCENSRTVVAIVLCVAWNSQNERFSLYPLHILLLVSLGRQRQLLSCIISSKYYFLWIWAIWNLLCRVQGEQLRKCIIQSVVHCFRFVGDIFECFFSSEGC